MKLNEIVSSLLQFEYTPWVLGVASLLLLGALFSLLGGMGAVISNPWLLAPLILLVVIGIFAFIRWGLPWWRKQRILRSPSLVAEEESTASCKTNFLHGQQELQRLEQGQTAQRPHFLLLGESASGKTAILQEAKFTCLTPALNAGSTRNCAWWTSLHAAILDTTGRYTRPVDMARDPEGWNLVLHLLLHHRQDIAIDGVIISLAADTLANRSSEQLRSDADKLRQRLQEAVKILGVDFPIYLVVTKCDLLEGFGDFFAQLSERIPNEVLGYINPDAAPLSHNGPPVSRGKAILLSLEKGLQSIYDRLHFFRLSLLNSRFPEEAGAAIFCFPEEFKELQRAISTMAGILFEERVGFHSLLFRGIFFTSAHQQDRPVQLLRSRLNLPEELPPFSGRKQPYFLNDLFSTILPRDRGLATTTEKMHTRRSIRSFLRSFLFMLVLVVLMLPLLGSYFSDRQIVAAVHSEACSINPQPKGSLQESLRGVDGCRQVVNLLTERNRQRSWWSSIGFRRSFQIERELRQQYVTNFKSSVLATLDEKLKETLKNTNQPREEPFALVMTLARRVRLTEQCQSNTQCGSILTDSSSQPDYALLLNPQSSSSAPSQDGEGEILKATYASYLLWQPNPALDLKPDLEQERQLLKDALSPEVLTPALVLDWLHQKDPQPIKYEDYWKLPDLVGKPSPSVNRACTKKVWEKDLMPVLQNVQGLVQESTTSLSAVQKGYTKYCLEQWQSFLALFPSGANRWNPAQRQRELAALLLTLDSPYQRVIETIVANIHAWHPTSEQEDESLPRWAERLSTIEASPEYKEYTEQLKKLGTVVGKEFAPEAALKLTQAAFVEPQPAEAPTHPLLMAASLAAKLSPKEGPPQAASTDIVAPLLQEPVRYVWRMLLDQTAHAIQTNWQETIVTPLAASMLPAAEKFASLYRPGEKFPHFTEQFLQPFLSKENLLLKTLLGSSVPLSQEFLQLVTAAQQLTAMLGENGTPQLVTIQAPQHSTIGGGFPLVEEQTILSIDCAPQPVQITNVPQGNAFKASESVLWSYQNCKGASVVVSLSTRALGPGDTKDAKEAVPTSQKFKLEKQYTGPIGVIQFFYDFLEGSHSFQLTDFAPNPEVRAILQDGATPITVYYTVTPPLVLKQALSSPTLPKDIVAPPLTEKANLSG